MVEPARSEVCLPLLWRGVVEDPSGYADEARAYLLALDRAGVAVTLRDVNWTSKRAGLPPSQQAAVTRARARRPDGEFVNLYHLVPGARLERTDRGPLVIRTMFETDALPAAWLPRLAETDEVWVPCSFNLETFARGGVSPERLRRLPETLDFDLYSPQEPPERGGPFTFLTSFDFTDRKGWDVLLDAWAEAFSPGDGVKLVLKCLSLHGLAEPAIHARVEQHLAGRPTAPIEVNTELLPLGTMPTLYASADAFVLASRGEGWGRPYMEAMAMGLPTIGSRWSGNLDFMHDANSWLVDGSLVAVSASAQAHTRHYVGQRWFEPDRDALVAALREVAAGGSAVARRAAAARPELLERFGPEPTVARLIELTEGALNDWRERRRRRAQCCWRGDWGSVHSLAVVNEALAGALEASGEAAVMRSGVDGDELSAPLVGVAHHWPPVFEAPSGGPFVLYQPWEFGEIPAAWVEPIRVGVDEVWTPSEYSRQAFTRAGLAPDLIRVVPNGVDLERFSPTGSAYPLPTSKATVFLFVGGTTYRKGIDLLLEAYGEAFSADDDVCLVVKSFGAQTVYRGQGGLSELRAFSERPGAPELVLLEHDLAFAEIPALYRAADCLVQPYRGEGFCLPALEALATGLPVIVTAGGPTDDFTSPACAWQLPSRTIPLPANALGGAYLPAGGGSLLEPDRRALAAALRAATDPAARAAKAATAREHAARFSWAAAAAVVTERLTALAGRRPIRGVAPAALADRRALLLSVEADWDAAETWAPAVRAFATAFAPGDQVTLLLPGGDADAEQLVIREILAAGASTDQIADLVLTGRGEVNLDSIALAADAFICTGGRRPLRARRVVEAEPAALRTLLTTA